MPRPTVLTNVKRVRNWLKANPTALNLDQVTVLLYAAVRHDGKFPSGLLEPILTVHGRVNANEFTLDLSDAISELDLEWSEEEWPDLPQLEFAP